ncbi:hypothetical protein AUQ48_07935 [Kocuria flava]|uniref:Rv3660c-like CheY-like N-terminal domain-containing protein n=1 Tax=Kocuria flava TaxID=446860 RepID=A0A2N4T1T3_9MICC|nr:septum site-determining protein Ssd [Kocuria flava]PLC12178.1 hypothetical protein AUQ48_07935 [Kocuria flava]
MSTSAATASPSRPAGPDRVRTVRLTGDDEALRGVVEHVCAAAGARLLPAPGTGGAPPEGGPAADLELLDVRAAAGPARPGTVLVGRSEDPGLWDRAAELGGCPVAVLPEAAGWLAERVAGADPGAGGAPGGGRVLGVLGAVGGAGASTLACWLADGAAGETRPAVLVDADREGCGIDVLLGTEEQDGLRWPDLLRVAGPVHAEQLWPALARTGPLRWLSWDRSLPGDGPAPYPGVLEALRRAAGLVVVDLGRCAPEAAATAALCDEVLVVAPRTVRGVLAARRAAALLGPVPARLVPAGLDVADVDDAFAAATTGLAVAGPLRFAGSVPGAAETGRLLEAGRARRTARDVARLLRATGVLA